MGSMRAFVTLALDRQLTARSGQYSDLLGGNCVRRIVVSARPKRLPHHVFCIHEEIVINAARERD